MTGFGLGLSGQGENRVELEIRSMNSRFLEVKIRGLNIKPETEEKIRFQISNSLKRGNVHVLISLCSGKDSLRLKFNKQRYETIQSVINDIHVKYGQRLGLSNMITASDLLITSDPDHINPDIILKAVDKSLKQLNAMRLREGKLIQKDISARIELLLKNIDVISNYAEDYRNESKDILYKKISKIIKDKILDDNRLLQEVGYLIEKADITEEIVRCRIHLGQLKRYLNDDEPVGKRINFLLQEISREINTIGAKSPKTEITACIVEIKNEIEKIREQTQNIL